MRKLLLILFLFFILGCSNMEKKAFFVDKLVNLEVIETEEEKARGLMFRDNLEKDKGLLFVYDDPEARGFWMKNVKFSIDIIWLDNRSKVVHIERNVPPCLGDTCKVYYPSKEAYDVIEVNANFTLDNNVKVGDFVRIL